MKVTKKPDYIIGEMPVPKRERIEYVPYTPLPSLFAGRVSSGRWDAVVTLGSIQHES